MEPRRCTAITYVRCRREHLEQLQQDSTSRSFEQWKVIQSITILAIRLDVALLLLKSGADVNTRNKYNKTPLHEASAIGNINISRLLLNAGADVSARDNQSGSCEQ